MEKRQTRPFESQTQSQTQVGGVSSSTTGSLAGEAPTSSTSSITSNTSDGFVSSSGIPASSTSAMVISDSSATSNPITTSVQPASTNSSTSSAPNATSSSGLSSSTHSGVSTATLAGAAVGAAIGGALLAALIMFFVMRRKNRNAGRSNSARMMPMGGSEKSYANVNTREVGLAGAAARSPAWIRDLPQPAPDDTVRMNARTLFHQIELHVENFYVDVRRAESSLTPDIMEEIEEFDDRTLPAPILTLIRQTSKPTSVIKRALAQHIISNISISDMKQTSFLPAECTALTQLRRNNAPSNNKSRSPEALAQWRVLTAYLRPQSTPPTNVSTSQLTPGDDGTIRSAAAQFSRAFVPWANPGQSGAVTQNLEAIMRSAAQTGLLFFSQPAEFAFGWTEDEGRQSGRRRLVVTPALLKVRDDNSRLIHPASVIVPPGIAEL